MMKKVLVGLLLTAAPMAASAADGWQFAITPYAWVPGMSNSLDTRFGTVSSSSSSSNALSSLDIAFMGAIEARHDRWSIIGDLLYTDLSQDFGTKFDRLFDGGSWNVKGTAFSGYALYRVVEDPKGSLDLGAGFRSFWLDASLDLNAGRIEGRSYDLNKDWTDPLIAARGKFFFDDHWFAVASADYGGFDGANDTTWQVIATAGYAFDQNWTVQGGWRYMDIQQEIKGRQFESELSGPLIGFSYRF